MSQSTKQSHPDCSPTNSQLADLCRQPTLKYRVTANTLWQGPQARQLHIKFVESVMVKRLVARPGPRM